MASQWGAWSDGESNVDGKPPVFLCLVQVHMIILHGLYCPFLRVGLVPSLARAAALTIRPVGYSATSCHGTAAGTRSTQVGPLPSAPYSGRWGIRPPGYLDASQTLCLRCSCGQPRYGPWRTGFSDKLSRDGFSGHKTQPRERTAQRVSVWHSQGRFKRRVSFNEFGTGLETPGALDASQVSHPMRTCPRLMRCRAAVHTCPLQGPSTACCARSLRRPGAMVWPARCHVHYAGRARAFCDALQLPWRSILELCIAVVKPLVRPPGYR